MLVSYTRNQASAELVEWDNAQMMKLQELFQPWKLSIIEFKRPGTAIITPYSFQSQSTTDHRLQHKLQLAFQLIEKPVKAEFSGYIKTDSNGVDETEAKPEFEFVFCVLSCKYGRTARG
jgi:hypothetical protein